MQACKRDKLSGVPARLHPPAAMPVINFTFLAVCMRLNQASSRAFGRSLPDSRMSGPVSGGAREMRECVPTAPAKWISQAGLVAAGETSFLGKFCIRARGSDCRSGTHLCSSIPTVCPGWTAARMTGRSPRAVAAEQRVGAEDDRSLKQRHLVPSNKLNYRRAAFQTPSEGSPIAA
jgi:hypothetical protein